MTFKPTRSTDILVCTSTDRNVCCSESRRGMSIVLGSLCEMSFVQRRRRLVLILASSGSGGVSGPEPFEILPNCPAL